MARIRYIKPEFFEDEVMAILPDRVQLLYIGLWCHMDRDGVVEYSPAVLKSKIFPHTDISKDQFAALIEVLVREKRLRRISHNGKTYLHCVKFGVHQLIHKNERPKYRIPKDLLESTVSVPYKDGTSTVLDRKELERELVIGIGMGEGKDASSICPGTAAAGPDQLHPIRPSDIEHLKQIVGTEYLIKLGETYPDELYLKTELKKFHLHFSNEPKKGRKTPRGWRTALTGWMARGWDRYLNSLPGHKFNHGRAANV